MRTTSDVGPRRELRPLMLDVAEWLEREGAPGYASYLRSVHRDVVQAEAELRDLQTKLEAATMDDVVMELDSPLGLLKGAKSR